MITQWLSGPEQVKGQQIPSFPNLVLPGLDDLFALENNLNIIIIIILDQAYHFHQNGDVVTI